MNDDLETVGVEDATPTNPAALDAMAKEAQRIEEDCRYSSKSHFETSARWSSMHLAVGLPATIIAACGGVTSLAEYVRVGGSLAVLAAALMATLTFVKPNARAQEHQGAGSLYLALKNKARSFRQIDLLGPATSFSHLRRELKTLENERDHLSRSGPQIPRWAFARARAGIEAGEASYEVDK